MPRIAVIHYSSTGHVHRLAEAIAEGAVAAGATVRVRAVPETAPSYAVASNPAWDRFHSAHVHEPKATLEDLDWADGIALGTPVRFGLPAAQLKQFIDTTGGLWARGKLAGKAATAFTSAQNVNGGQEATILALHHVFNHWGSVIVPPGYTDPAVTAAGGNPYGTSLATGDGLEEIPAATLDAARHQGARLAEHAALLTRAAAATRAHHPAPAPVA